MRRQGIKLSLILLFTGAAAFAQPMPAPAPVPEPFQHTPPPPPASRPPMSALQPGRPGRWWSNPELAQKLGLTPDQRKKMDDIFQQHRLKLIDLKASLEKEEAILEPLVAADQPDEPKILSQIDRVAQARAELEKANARMLVGIRRVLTQEQWEKLQQDTPRARARPVGPPGGPLRAGPEPRKPR